MLQYILSIIIGLFTGIISYTVFMLFYTSPKNRNILTYIFPFLYCPDCERKITFLNLIPVAGYFLTGMRCKKCKSVNIVIYHIILLLNILLSLLVSIKFDVTCYALNIYLILILAALISIIDIKKNIIPNTLVIIFLLLTIYPAILNNSFKDTLFGLLLMGIFFIAILLIFPGSFGGGDVKYASTMGIMLGLQLSIVALQTALVTGSIAGIVYAVLSGKGLRSKIPFAPFLSFGLFISLIYGRSILSVYYKIMY